MHRACPSLEITKTRETKKMNLLNYFTTSPSRRMRRHRGAGLAYRAALAEAKADRQIISEGI